MSIDLVMKKKKNKMTATKRRVHVVKAISIYTVSQCGVTHYLFFLLYKITIEATV